MGSNTALVLNADGTCVYTLKYMYEKETFQTTLDEAKDKSPLFSGDFTRAEETVGDMTYYTFSRQLTFASADAMKTALTDLTAYINRMKEGSVNPSLYTTEFIASTPFSEVTLDGTTFIATLTRCHSSMTSSMSSNMTKRPTTPLMRILAAVSKKYTATAVFMDI